MSFSSDVVSVSAEIGAFAAREEAVSKVKGFVYGVKSKVYEKTSALMGSIPGVVNGVLPGRVKKLEHEAREKLEEARGRKAEERIKGKYYAKSRTAAFAVAGAAQSLSLAGPSVLAVEPPQVLPELGFAAVELAGPLALPAMDLSEFNSSIGGSRFDFSFLKKIKPPSVNISKVSRGLSKVPHIGEKDLSKVSDAVLENKYLGRAFSAGVEKGIENGVSEAVDKGVDDMIAPLQERMEEEREGIEAKVRSKLDCCCVREGVGECIEDVKTVAAFRTRRCRAHCVRYVDETKACAKEKVLFCVSSLRGFFGI